MLKIIKNAYAAGPFDENNVIIRGARLFTPTLHAIFVINPKTRNDKAENGSFLGEKNLRNQTLMCSWQKLIKSTFSLDAEMMLYPRRKQ